MQPVGIIIFASVMDTLGLQIILESGRNSLQRECQIYQNMEKSVRFVIWNLQWVLKTLGGWEDELAYCDELLEDDIYNNSAWNRRYFVVTKSPVFEDFETIRDSEVGYAVKAILSKPDNESPWRYLRGLYKNNMKSISEDPRVPSVCLDVLKGKTDFIHALNMVADLLYHKYQLSDELKNAIDAISAGMDLSDLSLAGKVYSVLQKVDPIRTNYWEWRKSTNPTEG